MFRKIISAALVVLYIPLSLVWNLMAIGFMLPLWEPTLGGTGIQEWSEGAPLVPIGCLMLIVWLVSLMFLLLRFVKKNNNNDRTRGSGRYR